MTDHRRSHQMAQFDRSKCFFCPNTNSCTSIRCNACKALTLPTKEDDQRAIEWHLMAFGSNAPAPCRSPSSFFDKAFESLDGLHNAAIYIGDAKEEVLLIQRPIEGDKGGLEKQFCIGTTQPNGEKRIRTWTFLDGVQGSRRAFFGPVRRILARGTMISGSAVWHLI
ncbi:uncharacterized protein PV07_09263 [Cladophialophora immunda]|uniref:Uncharacterized protein n=1 Tax=Cladophialophora immunda TaxID=569365 RepID=A0A0D2C6L2_9EURO|nr:uncharacterized protein PV07_09263 [Cladophialophora immunda]KIW26140.1 hypothetical protein PV07_09263 [Cladophialophora immunda]OQU95967.1 hypothetical protein CLAIMM_02115 isoform 1 [Cladophialophora immunda]OQU95968.1 hypothetical protein CLAIMM_02115 isoform 2 [Cladophialophora immunda]